MNHIDRMIQRIRYRQLKLDKYKIRAVESPAEKKRKNKKISDFLDTLYGVIGPLHE